MAYQPYSGYLMPNPVDMPLNRIWYIYILYIYTIYIYIYIYEVHTISYQTFFVRAFKIVVDS